MCLSAKRDSARIYRLRQSLSSSPEATLHLPVKHLSAKDATLGEVVGFEGGVDPGAVEPDDNIAGDVDDRNAALAGFVYGL
jgi:hypothetical protein